MTTLVQRVEASSGARVNGMLVPIRTESLNQRLRGNWRARAGRTKKERGHVALMLTQLTRPALPVSVLLRRLSVGRLDDDNLRGALKGVRDEVALWLGVDDADARVTWLYEQQRDEVPGVLVAFEERTA